MLAGTLYKLIREIHEETGAEFELVNPSGGIGVPYRPEQKKTDIYAISRGVKKQYDEILAPAGLSPKIFTELGRYMLAPYGALITKVVHFKHIYKEYAGVDACAANLMRPAI